MLDVLQPWEPEEERPLTTTLGGATAMPLPQRHHVAFFFFAWGRIHAALESSLTPVG